MEIMSPEAQFNACNGDDGGELAFSPDFGHRPTVITSA